MNENNDFLIRNPNQLKAWIKNMAKENKLAANTVLQSYMMERLLERISLSQYRNNFILKGGFLIAAMVGIEMRSTMDMDTTIKGLSIDKKELERIVNEILLIPVQDNVTFEMVSIEPIHEVGKYEDYRIGIIATFFTMRVNLKLDITTGDIIIPREVEYSFKLMFEDRDIRIKAYNLNTILAEKIESILVRNVVNTRARDFYDVYILLTTRLQDIEKIQLLQAIKEKSVERGTEKVIDNYKKYLKDIEESQYLKNIWISYTIKYPYATGIQFDEIIKVIELVFES